MSGAIAKAEELLKAIPGSFCCGQFDNPDNAEAHYLTTAQEIWADTEGRVDILVSAIGTGGTVTGITRRPQGIQAGYPDHRRRAPAVGGAQWPSQRAA